MKAMKTTLLQVEVDEELLRLIDEYRWQLRLPSRSAAVRELLRRGIPQGETAGEGPRYA